MSNLTAFNQDGIEIYIDTVTGESFASINGYARMSGVPRSSVQNRLKGSPNIEVKTAEVLTAKGLQVAKLINEKLIAEWLLKDNPETATKLLTLGIRVFLHTLAGYKVEIPKTYSQALMAAAVAEAEKERLLEEAKVLIAENEELSEFKEEVSEYEQFLDLLEITKNEVSEYDYPDGITVSNYLIEWNNNSTDYVDTDDWNTISKRASSFYRLLEGRHPDKNSKNRNIFKGKKVAYIIATIKLVKSGI